MSQNAALLQIAGVLESVRSAIINGDGTAYDPMEVFALCMQSTIQILCGGTPSSIVLPKIIGPAGLNDPAIARFCSGQIPATPFAPLNLATASGIPTDGSDYPGGTTITFAAPFATSCSQVIGGFTREYNGDDNAILVPRIVTGSITKTGFSILVGGGLPGSTCSVDYYPVGS